MNEPPAAAEDVTQHSEKFSFPPETFLPLRDILSGRRNE
jgi:hypothetical protein